MGLMICAICAAACIIDYIRYLNHQMTLSVYCLGLIQEPRPPIFWIVIGIIIGGSVMFLLGLIVGHLFWPQYPVQ
jgi:purine-cytosine permease-like protein